MTDYFTYWLGAGAFGGSPHGDWSPEADLARRGYQRAGSPILADVLVLSGRHPAADADLAAALAAGAGVVVILERGQEAPTLPVDAGITVQAVGRGGTSALEHAVAAHRGTGRAGLHPAHTADAATPAEDLLARVDVSTLRPSAVLQLTDPATALLRSAGSESNADSALAATAIVGDSRVVVLGVVPDSSAAELLANSIAYAARRNRRTAASNQAQIVDHPAWVRLKAAVCELRPMQVANGSIPRDHHQLAGRLVAHTIAAIEDLTSEFPHDADYLAATVKDFSRWADSDFDVPDFLDSLLAFHPERDRTDGRRHLVVFPMYTQNGNPDRNVEAVLIEELWPDFIRDLEAGDFSNKLFVPIRFLDFTPGYDTNSAVLFPETVAMREIPTFSWGAIFADREAARFTAVVTAAADMTGLALPPDAARLLADSELAEQTFVMWDLIHDRTHMHGDLPFDPFMIKQRMPYFLYTLEELRCDLTAFRASVALEQQGLPHARLVQYAILFDRIFRFPITGSRVRNYDGLGGQLLFAWLHQHHVLHWTDNRLTIDWAAVADSVLELGRQIEHLYWQSIDRSKTAHWLAVYQLVSGTVAPNPASTWAKGPDALPLDGPPRGLTDAVMPDEFPLSMFYEALNRKLAPVVAATAGITGGSRPPGGGRMKQ